MESEDEGVIGGNPCRPEEARLQDLEADNSRLRSELNVKDQEIEELNTKVQGLLVSYSRSYFGPPLSNQGTHTLGLCQSFPTSPGLSFRFLLFRLQLTSLAKRISFWKSKFSPLSTPPPRMKAKKNLQVFFTTTYVLFLAQKNCLEKTSS